MNKERTINTFFDLVKIDSETGNEKGVADYLEPILKDLDFSVVYDDANSKFPSNTGNLIAKRGNTQSADTLMLSCHMDTVTPGVGIEPTIVEDKIVSKGDTILGSDDKSGIAAIIEALRYFDDTNQATIPLEIVFCIAEEGGLNGSKYLDYSLIDAKQAVVLDSAGQPGDIVIKGPGQDKIDVTVIGKPAHAGVSPEAGISAIQVASLAINRMQLLRIDDDTTANIGTIQGGQATNIVCPEVTIKAEARSLDAEKLKRQTAHMVSCFEQAAGELGAKVDIAVSRAYDAFKIDADLAIVKRVQGAFKALGIEARLKGTGGGSDANNYNAKGIHAVNIATGMTKAHTLDEYITVADLITTVDFLKILIAQPKQ